MKILRFSPFSILAFAVLLFSVEAAVADETLARSYDIKNVSEVVVGGGGRIRITQGDTETLRVEAEADVINRVSVDLSGNKLSLNVKRSSGKGFSLFDFFSHQNDEVLYILQLKNLSYLGLSGASRATLSDWVGKNMAVNVSGAGEINFANLSVDDLFVELTGASNAHTQSLTANKIKFELSGAANANIKAQSQTKFLQVGASGASNFRGKLLTVTQADVGASGASNIELNVTEFLKANASGASNVRYLGQPKLQSDSSGASHVSSIN
ncbi:DUF2807 domain-containing protein [Cellvibrio zantedeschiae]|uniref:DUF2807 domain-containing protein n=1 Tax=Cellvibrio zantedeschiae TaxID=1237077 RepID=A0ABQ3B2U2_9GAMM|nr:DUF2807 domain-containing protein [Cellvibrio zantedeschiae]GGY77204.1 DUF2807 domain-containing protein [Cellvibrio zantedeschiae]